MNKTKILAVDDDAGVLAVLKQAFDALGSVEVRTEQNPRQALPTACADYFVAKPATIAQLLRAIEERLGRPLRQP